MRNKDTGIHYDMIISKISVPGCEPALFWFLARHGTRNPGISDIENMRDILPGVRDKMVDAWTEGVGAWRRRI